MSQRDFSDDIAAIEALSHGTYTDDKNGSDIDMQNRDKIVFILNVSGYTDGTHDFAVQSAPDDGTGNAGSYSDVSSSNLNGSFPSVDASGDKGLHKVGVYGVGDRFMRISTTTSSTSSGATYGVTAVASGLRYDLGGRNPGPTN